MNKILKLLLFGFLAWLVPFVTSFFFYSREGQVLIDIFFFKTIMILVGALTGALLLVLYFKPLRKRYLREAVIAGLVWFAISILLDLLILLPMSGMPAGTYFTQIGLRYLTLPIMSTALGLALEEHTRR